MQMSIDTLRTPSGSQRQGIVKDPLRALDPTAGIAKSTNLYFDDKSGLWTVAVDIGLGQFRSSIDGVGVSLVGAAGFARSDALLRGAGEAVERFALIPTNRQDNQNVDGTNPARVKLEGTTTGRAAFEVDYVSLCCVPARRVGGTTDVLIPNGLVDDPLLGSNLMLFDPSPSGAAAGGSFEDAALASLLESIERDAVQCAWSLRPRLNRIDTHLAMELLRSGQREGRLLAESLQEEEDVIQFVVIPTGILGLTAVIALVFDRRVNGPVAAGCSVSTVLSDALARAGREAIQVLMLLQNLQKTGVWSEKDQIEELATDEMARAKFWASTSASQAAKAWLDGLDPLAETDPILRCVSSRPGLYEINEALLEEGLDPLICDLTERLPKVIREAGWFAAKAIVLGHQPLRMNEIHSFSWCHPRLETWAQRWGCSSGPSSVSHPFI
jgi:ribosomal protein S12 methylthiotransferase accessory factor